jgi:hypothetical protein
MNFINYNIMASQKIKLLGGDYIYNTPEIPKDEKEILFYDKKKKDQFWSIPNDIVRFKNMTMSEKKQFVEIERNRWLNGLWFFNNGEPTYITGMHYDHLVYQTFEFGKARYLESQRHDFYFRDYCMKDKDCYGMLWLKPRRYGMTTEEITHSQYIATSNYGRQVGAVSNENKKTIDTIFRPIVDSYIKRPKYLRPTIYMPNGRKPKKEILFQSATVKELGGDDLFMDNRGDLNGWIIPKPTTVTAYDGTKLHYLIVDEIWKWIICNPQEFWGSHKKCFEDGGDIIGKASLLSTMGDSDDYKMAVKCGVDMWHESDPSNRPANNRTKTGLYRYFIDAIYSVRKFADVYGFIDVEKAEEYLDEELSKIDPSSSEYIFEKRRMPRCPEDALAGADTAAIFTNKRLSSRVESIKRSPKGDKPYVRGNFIELNDGKVEFEPDNDGIWKITNLPKTDILNKLDYTNRYKKVGEKYFKPINPEWCGGYDPVNFADVDTTSGNKSRASIIFRQKFDYYGNGGQNRYSAILVYRPEEPDEAHYEAIKACRFFAAPLMIDRSGLTGIKKKFTEHGMVDFLLKNPKDGVIGMWADNQKRFVKEGVNKMVGYFKLPTNENELDYINEHPFEELLEDMIPFDPNKTTKSDVVMSNILLEYGAEQIKETNLTDSSGTKFNNPLFAKRT